MPFLKKMIERKWQILEAAHPSVISGLIGIYIYFYPFVLPKDHENDVINGSLTVSALIIGFLATSKSIMMGYKGTKLFNSLRQNGQLARLTGYLKFSIYTSMVFLALSFSLHFGVTPLKVWFWIVSGSVSIISFIRIIRLQSKLIGE